MATTLNRKINHIFLLLEKLANNQELYAQNTQLQLELFGNNTELKDANKANERSLRRYLDDIHTLYQNIIVTEKKTKAFTDRKVTVYRIVARSDISAVLKFFLEEKNDLTWIIQMLHEQDPSLLHELESDTKIAIENELKEDENIFLFNSKPFEVLDSYEQKKIFSSLKQAVKNHEYRTIHYKYNETAALQDVKCLKMIYAQNNWYIAVETNENKLRLIRIQFVSHISYSQKSTYQKNILNKYQEYFANFENPMTLEGIKKETAIIKVLPSISRYFQEGMKPFFKSQTFIKAYEDESIEFSINYTQAIEILPFIKQWLPNMHLLAPSSLKDQLQKELELSLNALKQS